MANTLNRYTLSATLMCTVLASAFAGCAKQGASSATSEATSGASSSAASPAASAQDANAGKPFRTLYSFEGTTDGADPGRLVALSGALFGSTRGSGVAGQGEYYGTLFTVTPAGDEHPIYTFKGGKDGGHPEELVRAGDAWYGYAVTSEGTGLVFGVDHAGKGRIVYRFAGASGGDDPSGPLAYVNGILYGTTMSGGANHNGTVFALRTDGTMHVLYAFPGGSGGANPESGLVAVGNMLYGTTFRGGSHGTGSVFAIDTSGNEHVVYSFGTSPHDGVNPNGALVARDGMLYGTTTAGGVVSNNGGGNGDENDDDSGNANSKGNGNGTVFAVTLNGKGRVLHAFTDVPDGALPVAGLTAVRGALYGTTHEGGTFCKGSEFAGCGTVFEIDATWKERVLHRFAGGFDDGIGPAAEMVALNGRLYGTTSSGGSNNRGTVFEVTPGP